jgi:hypothetical protein
MSKEFKRCNECGKLSDLTTTCTFPIDREDIELCPTCLREDGSFCLSCGHFCSGIESFEFIHPGYCDNCWDEIEDANRWDFDEEEDGEWDGYDPEDEQEFPNGSLDY